LREALRLRRRPPCIPSSSIAPEPLPREKSSPMLYNII
jgi:hypothetical protein